jgi:AcrR family transcriptional regulator
LTTTATDTMRPNPSPAGQRGPVEHERRVQILEAANTYFRTYGYGKTTVADLAKAIGLSTAYIYKFFDSKQAIGEAVASQVLGAVAVELREIVKTSKPAATRLRLVYQTVARRGAEVCFTNRKLHDLAVTACTERWQAVRDHQAALLDIIRGLVAEGREAGEFERKTPIAETSLAILQTLELFSQPLFLEQNIDDPVGKAESVANLVLRSLAP